MCMVPSPKIEWTTVEPTLSSHLPVSIDQRLAAVFVQGCHARRPRARAGRHTVGPQAHGARPLQRCVWLARNGVLVRAISAYQVIR